MFDPMCSIPKAFRIIGNNRKQVRVRFVRKVPSRLVKEVSLEGQGELNGAILDYNPKKK